jgi:hypothetical protein
MYFLWLKTTGTWSVEIKVNAVLFLTIVEYGTLVKDLHQTYFMTLPDGKLKAVYKKGDKFCDAKKVKGKKTFTPIKSQPENVIELVRNYSVSWLGIGARESIAMFFCLSLSLHHRIYHLFCTLLSICRRVKS